MYRNPAVKTLPSFPGGINHALFTCAPASLSVTFTRKTLVWEEGIWHRPATWSLAEFDLAGLLVKKKQNSNDSKERSDADVLVLQTGSKEISDIQVNEALVDPEKDIDAYKKDWFNQVENDSIEVFNIAQSAAKSDPKLKVVIMKRMKRYDRTSSDITCDFL